MPQENFIDLVAFIAVAKEGSFTKAAVRLGVSQSALSQTVRGLEERLGLRLLTRTTRSVSPTDAGERLLRTAGPRFEEIQAELSALSEMRDKPAGTIRITAGEHAAISVLAPALDRFLPANPDVNVEITVDYGLTDVVSERYDAGVRLGEQLAKDMIAVKIRPEMRMAVVGSPSYFRQHPWPEAPQDLTAHNCIQIRMPTHGNILQWEFEKEGHEVNVRVDGQTRLQQYRHAHRRCLARVRACLHAGGSGGGPYSRRSARSGAGGLVPAVSRLPSLLSQPTACISVVQPGAGRAAIPRMMR